RSHLDLDPSRFDQGVGAEGMVDAFAAALAGRRCLLIANTISDSTIGRLLLRFGTPATVLLATKRDALDVLGIPEIIQITPVPPRSPTDYALDLDRLTLFPPAPSSFSPEAAAAVLGRDIDWT